jgi:hypothetical protein
MNDKMPAPNGAVWRNGEFSSSKSIGNFQLLLLARVFVPRLYQATRVLGLRVFTVRYMW